MKKKEKKRKEWILPLIISIILALITAGQLSNQYINSQQDRAIEILQKEQKEDIIDKTKLCKDVEFIKEKITRIFEILSQKILTRGKYEL